MFNTGVRDDTVTEDDVACLVELDERRYSRREVLALRFLDLFALDIRLIHAGIGANKTVMCFGNQNSAVHFDNATRLLQHDLDMARIFPPLLRETLRQLRISHRRANFQNLGVANLRDFQNAALQRLNRL